MKVKEDIKSEYELQAEEFLAKTGTKMEFLYTGHRRHFDTDKECRACYQVTIIRGEKHMTLDFGQSIADSWKLYDNRGNHGFKIHSGPGLPLDHKAWTVTTVKKAIETGQELTSLNGSLILRKKNLQPTPYDILSSITKYHPGTFEDFCSDFGYDNDSMRAFKTYQAVLKEYTDVSRLFTESELEEMQEIN